MEGESPSTSFQERKTNMVVTAKATVMPMKLPLVVEKDGVRYTCDIADDATGIDLVITKNEETQSEGEGK